MEVTDFGGSGSNGIYVPSTPTPAQTNTTGGTQNKVTPKVNDNKPDDECYNDGDCDMRQKCLMRGGARRCVNNPASTNTPAPIKTTTPPPGKPKGNAFPLTGCSTNEDCKQDGKYMFCNTTVSPHVCQENSCIRIGDSLKNECAIGSAPRIHDSTICDSSTNTKQVVQQTCQKQGDCGYADG